jgi:hypothetical protein
MEGGEKMNKKILVLVAMLAFSLLLTPLALAKPGAEKKNSKFESFYLEVSGFNIGEEKFWYTPPNADPLDNKTTHSRGGIWLTWPGANLTVGGETFRMDTDPYNITWTTTYDSDVVRYNNGTVLRNNIRLTDVVTMYDANNESIGTLVLKLKSALGAKIEGPVFGSVVGYGTGAFEDVHISAVDLGVIFLDLTTVPFPTVLYAREGTITGWPEQISND